MPFARPAAGAMRIPNVVVVDDEGGVVYVSDSHGDGPGPGIWRYDIDTGEGGLWYGGDLDWANGMVLSPDRIGDPRGRELGPPRQPDRHRAGWLGRGRRGLRHGRG